MFLVLLVTGLPGLGRDGGGWDEGSLRPTSVRSSGTRQQTGGSAILHPGLKTTPGLQFSRCPRDFSLQCTGIQFFKSLVNAPAAVLNHSNETGPHTEATVTLQVTMCASHFDLIRS